MKGTDAALFEVRGNVGWLTLNRPERLNALNVEMVTLMQTYLDEAANNPGIKVMVLTGAGRGFCSGADLRQLFGSGGAGTNPNVVPQHSGVQKFTAGLYNIDKPVIAAVNGPAVGAGFEMTLTCDVRIAAESAYFMEAAMRHGLVPGDGSVLMLPKVVGAGRAYDILLSGDRVHAREALEMGLVRSVLPDNQFIDGVQEYASRLAEYPLDATAMLKQSLRFAAGGPDLGSVFSFLRLAVSQGKSMRRQDGSIPS